MRKTILLLLLFSTTAYGQGPTLFTGFELLRFDLGERSSMSDGLLTLGAEFHQNRNFAVGFSFGVQDQDILEGANLKGDIFARYRFFLNSATDFFVAGGAAAVNFEEQQCRQQSASSGDVITVQTICESRSFESSGLSYQLGTSFDVGQGGKLNVFFAQFFGSHDTRMSMIGVNGSF